MWELSVTLDEMKNKALDENFIIEMKKKLKDRIKTESEVFAMTFSCTAKEWWYYYPYRNEFLKNSSQDILIYPEWKA